MKYIFWGIVIVLCVSAVDATRQPAHVICSK